MKDCIIRFPEDQIIWLSNILYKTRSPDSGYFRFPLGFEGYHEIIGQHYKIPEHFYFKAQITLECILSHYLHELVWDVFTGYINVEASNKYLYTYLSYSDFRTSPTTTKKIISILEELSVVKILEKTNKNIRLKLYLQKFNEFLKKGTERWEEADKAFCEMNDIDFDGVVEYGGVA